MKRFLAVVTVLASIAGSGCGPDQIAGPGSSDLEGPGVLELRISIPHAGASALLITIGGGPVDSLTSDLDALLLASTVTEQRAILRGTMQGVATIRLWVPDVAHLPDYTASVLQAVDGTTYEQRTTAGYQTAITSRRTRNIRRPSA